MNLKFYELADNRVLGIDAFEVGSLPGISNNMKSADHSDCEKISRETLIN